MAKKSFADLGTQEFESLLENMVSEDYEQLTAEEFLGAWSALSAPQPAKRIDLTGEVCRGQLVLDPHSPVPVQGNEIHLDQWMIVIHLRPGIETALAAPGSLP